MSGIRLIRIQQHHEPGRTGNREIETPDAFAAFRRVSQPTGRRLQLAT